MGEGIRCWECDEYIVGTPVTIISNMDTTFRRTVCTDCANHLRMSAPNVWREICGEDRISK